MSRNVNSPESPRRAGRPPSQRARNAIVSAARSMMEERGLTGVTMEGVAALAGVGKPTVYRHFANRHELAMAALMQMATADGRIEADGDPIRDLKDQLFAMAALFESPTGRFAASVLASGHGETEMSKAFRGHFIEQRREQSGRLLDEAREKGAIRHDADIELALDQLYGAILYRLLIGGAAVNRKFVAELLEQLLRGIA
jgi:AcrR family transcriptional regulator